MNRIIISLFILLALPASVLRAEYPKVAPSYAWSILQPLGLHHPAPIDTLMLNYYRTAVPSAMSEAFVTTGNQASAGKNMIYMDQAPVSDFFLKDAKRYWLPSESTQRFYNSRIPMSIVGYNTGGGREIAQDWFRFLFSGNFSPKGEVGLKIDYPYSKGSYANQASKMFSWNLFGSYMGDRYEFQGYTYSYTSLMQENGGITDDLYITDPAEIQGGMSKVNPKQIPTNLRGARSRVMGKEFYMNHRYKVGFWHETRDSIDTDSVVAREYVPVSSFIWTFSYGNDRHRFLDSNSADADFWTNSYINKDVTEPGVTKMTWLRNTLGISLLEGFNKYAKAGLAAFVTHEMRTFDQVTDTIPISGPDRPEGLTPYPYGSRLTPHTRQNLVYVGAQLTKQQGAVLNYEGTVKIGLVGPAAGEIMADGNVSTHIRLFGDTVSLKAYGHLSNTTAPFLINNYVSNHFIWKNDFGKTRRVRFGGVLNVPQTSTNIDIGGENIQNMLLFDGASLPAQAG
ncbi:MAG: putative porin, partial [Duncaniella sp.]|nr:putative porin [Duncaniella sp.]